MDKKPLNTGEQKDMNEFFTDLITKLEDMSPDMVSIHLLHISQEFCYVKSGLYVNVADLFPK